MSMKTWQQTAVFVSKYFMIKHYNVQYEYRNISSDEKGPFLVLGNHTSAFDPFLLKYGLKEPIHFVTSDLYFRNRVLGYCAGQAGCIPKAKFVSDFRVVRQLVQYAREGEAIGIYPEGYCTWSGETDEFLPGIEKLIKLLRIPVIAVATHGGYLTKPRWGKHTRQGKIVLHYERILTPEEIARSSVETIKDILYRTLHQNDYEWQRTQMIPYKGKKPAETLEFLLYCCPHCGKFETLNTKGNVITCAVCGYSASINRYGFFETLGTQWKVYFDNANDWYRFCKDKLKQLLHRHADDKAVFQRSMTLMQGKNRFSEFEKTDTGLCMLFKNKIVFQGSEKSYAFPFREIRGFTLSKMNLIDFYYRDIKYRMNPNSSVLSGLLWEDVYKLCADIAPKEQIRV